MTIIRLVIFSACLFAALSFITDVTPRSTIVRLVFFGAPLFLALGSITGVLLTVSFTQAQRKRYSVLRYLDGKQIVLTSATILFFFLSFVASTYKDSLVAAPDIDFQQGSQSRIFRSATIPAFKKEIQDIASDRVAEAIAYFDAGTHDALAGRWEEATQNFEKSVSSFPTMSGLLNLGTGYVIIGNIRREQHVLEEGLKIARKKRDERFSGFFLERLGALATLQRRFSEAEGFLRTALDISMKNGEKLEILSNLNNLGEWYDRQGNYAKALETYQSALDRLKEGDIPKLRTMTLLNIGSTYVNQGRLDEAISQAETILELDRLKSNTEDDTTALMLLSNAWHKKGAREKAITYVTLAANVYKKKKIVFLEGITKRIIGSIYIEEHKYEDALRAFEDALKLQEKLQDPTWKAGTLQMIGGVYREQGNLHKAIDYLKMARVIYIEMGDDAVPSRRELDHKLFWLYVEEGLSRPKKEH